MRRFFASAALVLGFLLAAWGGSVTSHLLIEPGQQFVLGGQQRGAFRVRVVNSGRVPVGVAERRPDGTVQERGRLEPGRRADLAFAAGAAALVCNLGAGRAVLDAKITGDASVGMTYEALKK